MIRISGDLGGIIIIVMATLLFTGACTWLLGFIRDHFLGKHEGGKKVLTAIIVLVWLAALVLLALDLTGVAPIIRNVLFALLGN